MRRVHDGLPVVLACPQPGVQHDHSDVRQEIGDHVHPREQHSDGLDDGKVVEADGVNEKTPQPREGEYALHHDDPTDQPRHVECRDGEGGAHGVREGVAKDDTHLGQPLQPLLRTLADSLPKFWPNQLRVLMTAAAYVLLQEVRLRAAGTECARAQVGTLRERLLKLGARVEVSVRRVVVHLPLACPFQRSFRKIALAFGAASG